jgi:hypothetical protein
MRKSAAATAKPLTVTTLFEPTRLAQDALQAAYACLFPPAPRGITGAQHRRIAPPPHAGELIEGAGDECNTASGLVRAGIVRAAS